MLIRGAHCPAGSHHPRHDSLLGIFARQGDCPILDLAIFSGSYDGDVGYIRVTHRVIMGAFPSKSQAANASLLTLPYRLGL